MSDDGSYVNYTQPTQPGYPLYPVALARNASSSLQLGTFAFSCLGVAPGLASLGRNLGSGRRALPIVALIMAIAAVVVCAVFFVVY